VAAAQEQLLQLRCWLLLLLRVRSLSLGRSWQAWQRRWL
jgi:hypothetical protein